MGEPDYGYFCRFGSCSIPPSETVMLEKPRRSTDFIISKAMRSNIIGVGSIFLIVLLGMIYYFDHSTQGMNVHNLTIFFTFFVMLQFWNLFNARVFVLPIRHSRDFPNRMGWSLLYWLFLPDNSSSYNSVEPYSARNRSTGKPGFLL